MHNLTNQSVVVTGGSRGLGRGIAQALVARGARVTVVARDPVSLAAVEMLGVAVHAGDASDAATMDAVISDVKPTVLILNAGATPVVGTLDELDWDAFSVVWDNDVKAGLHGIQAALKAPLRPGSRVLVASSGAAMVGATLSGSYAGAKRMLWFMAGDANDLAKKRGLDIRFQALVPLQMIGDTAIVRTVCAGYGRHLGIGGDAYRANKNPNADVGTHARRLCRNVVDRSALRKRNCLRVQNGGRHHVPRSMRFEALDRALFEADGHERGRLIRRRF